MSRELDQVILDRRYRQGVGVTFQLFEQERRGINGQNPAPGASERYRVDANPSTQVNRVPGAAMQETNFCQLVPPTRDRMFSAACHPGINGRQVPFIVLTCGGHASIFLAAALLGRGGLKAIDWRWNLSPLQMKVSVPNGNT